MRILFSSELFWPYIGGAELFAAKLILALQQRGHQFIVVTRQDSSALPSEDNYQGIPICRFPFWTMPTDRNAVEHISAVRGRLLQLKRAFAPNLVHIQGFAPTTALFHLTTKNAYPIPLLFTLINELPGQAGGQDSLKQILRCADWVTGKATKVLTQARQLMPEITPRSSIIYNGLESSPLPLASEPSKTPRLLCLGRLVRQKGFDIALAALATVVDRFSDVRLIIAGDGPERSALQRQAAGLGLTDIVEFIGWVPPQDVPALINSATMVLMPSRWEGLPSVALQASMMARPIVATPVGGLSEVVIHEQTGLLVPPDDSVGLTAAIAFLLQHPDVAAQMGQAGRRRVQEVFSWQQCVDAYDALYRTLGNESADGK